jgi:hypothetical protein
VSRKERKEANRRVWYVVRGMRSLSKCYFNSPPSNAITAIIQFSNLASLVSTSRHGNGNESGGKEDTNKQTHNLLEFMLQTQ